MTDEELRLTDRYKVELENAIYYYRPRTDRETKLIELLILEKIRAIKELEKENEELNRDKTELVNSVTELESKVTELNKQIKKMKCCRNCKHFNQVEIHCDLYAKYECVNLDKWELTE